MTAVELIVTCIGLILIWFIYWFFFGKKESIAIASDEIKIEVDGGYNPAVIKVKKGIETTLKITRRDSNSCLEDIILPDFKIKNYLPLNQEVEIKVNQKESGEFPFHCGMNMYHGKIIVE